MVSIMSGHSKWSTIKRKKQATDQKRGQVFTKLAKLIGVAVKQGGGVGDPEKNFKLRLAIDRAKQANMPKDNVERAIAKATGAAGGEVAEEIIYEGYGPGGAAFMVQVLTDNRNRSAAQVKNIFERQGGRLAKAGAVSYLFENRGVLVVERQGDIEAGMLEIIDCGVEDVEKSDGKIIVYTKPSELFANREVLEKKGFVVLEASLSFEPENSIFINDLKLAKKLISLSGELEESEDVECVFSNFNIDDDLLKELE